jgi:hypothetical protein
MLSTAKERTPEPQPAIPAEVSACTVAIGSRGGKKGGKATGKKGFAAMSAKRRPEIALKGVVGRRKKNCHIPNGLRWS